jgi:vacuolar-type H+-ATPase subunit H
MPELEQGMPSKDLLEKLFNVEHEAEEIVADARAEAGRRLDAARTKAQKYYTEAYDAALAKALAAREQSDKKARDDYDNAIKDYREGLESSKLNEHALIAKCDEALGEIK